MKKVLRSLAQAGVLAALLLALGIFSGGAFAAPLKEKASASALSGSEAMEERTAPPRFDSRRPAPPPGPRPGYRPAPPPGPRPGYRPPSGPRPGYGAPPPPPGPGHRPPSSGHRPPPRDRDRHDYRRHDNTAAIIGGALLLGAILSAADSADDDDDGSVEESNDDIVYDNSN